MPDRIVVRPFENWRNNSSGFEALRVEFLLSSDAHPRGFRFSRYLNAE